MFKEGFRNKNVFKRLISRILEKTNAFVVRGQLGFTLSYTVNGIFAWSESTLDVF